MIPWGEHHCEMIYYINTIDSVSVWIDWVYSWIGDEVNNYTLKQDSEEKPQQKVSR